MPNGLEVNGFKKKKILSRAFHNLFYFSYNALYISTTVLLLNWTWLNNGVLTLCSKKLRSSFSWGSCPLRPVGSWSGYFQDPKGGKGFNDPNRCSIHICPIFNGCKFPNLFSDSKMPGAPEIILNISCLNAPHLWSCESLFLASFCHIQIFIWEPWIASVILKHPLMLGVQQHVRYIYTFKIFK